MSGRTKQTRTERARAASVTVGKPFPWGTVVGASALGLALFVVLGYAVLNAGSAAPNPLRDAEESVPGIEVAQESPAQEHRPGPLEYEQSPSWGGPHNGTWTTCTGQVYEDQVPEENAAHSMEHGAVWVSYRPDLPEDEVAALRGLVEGADYRLLSPFPGQKAPVSVQAWGRQLTVDSATDERLETFADEFTNGPQTPERGATCAGGTPATGEDPAAA